MNILRSEDIHLIKLVMTKNQSFDIAYQLGMINALQIIDLNKGQTVYNLQFAKEVK